MLAEHASASLALASQNISPLLRDRCWAMGLGVERSFDYLPRMIMAQVRRTDAWILGSTLSVMVLAVSASLIIFFGGLSGELSQELASFDPLLVR
jgi:hypothetical protein